MKQWKTAMLGIAVAALMVVTGCSASKSGDNDNQNRPTGGFPGGSSLAGGSSLPGGGAMGVITEIGEGTITVAQMPEGSMPQGTGQGDRQRPSGTAGDKDGGSPRPAPTGDASKSGDPAPSGERPQATFDTSGWEKKTWTVDGDTKIVSGSGSSGETLTLSDLKAGDSVSVTTKSGSDSVAGQITLMQDGMGGFPGGDRPTGDPGKS